MKIPENLLSWFDSKTLAGWVCESVNYACWNLPEPSVSRPIGAQLYEYRSQPVTQRHFRPGASSEELAEYQNRSKPLVRTLVYAYATGTYASMDIEQSRSDDPGFQYLSCPESVNEYDLRKSRRSNRLLLNRSLSLLLYKAWETRVTNSGGRLTTSMATHLENMEKEAERRILEAIALDHILIDDD